MEFKEFEGKNIEEAKQKAMRTIGISEEEQLDFEVIDEGKLNMFGLGTSRPAKIKARFKDTSYSSEPSSDNQTQNELSKAAENILKDLFSLMDLDAGLAAIEETDSRLYIDLTSPSDAGLIIGGKGKTLESLQFLVNLLVNRKVDDNSKKIVLNIESYREKREESLKNLSLDVAAKVISSGRPQALDPMNPFERRLVHLTLQNENRIKTESEGEGEYRQVVVKPV